MLDDKAEEMAKVRQNETDLGSSKLPIFTALPRRSLEGPPTSGHYHKTGTALRCDRHLSSCIVDLANEMKLRVQ